MYKVIKHFTDLQDNNYPYNVGDTFPRKGLNVTPERLAELASSANKQGVPLIEKVEEAPIEEAPIEEAPIEEAPIEKKPKKGTKTAPKK